MKIIIAGSSGFIGATLCTYLHERGHDVFRLVRSQTKEGDRSIYWNPHTQEVVRSLLEGYDAVINLCGENITGRWSTEKKKKIRESRVDTSRFLSQKLSELVQKPKVLINASAIGYYGDRGSEILDESSPAGTSFLADVCTEWEAATLPAENAGIRVVKLRIGVVLSTKGGAFSQMLFPFKWGLGGILGQGDQWISWISLDDMIRVIELCLHNETLQGPINLVSPHPVTNHQLTKQLGKALHRPTFFSQPSFIIRTLFGQMGEELLLASTRVEPNKLKATGYCFLHPRLEDFFYATFGSIKVC